VNAESVEAEAKARGVETPCSVGTWRTEGRSGSSSEALAPRTVYLLGLGSVPADDLALLKP
jgi:hypothetical protein